jgi:hypothetical protein
VFRINWRIAAVKRVVIGLMLLGLIFTTAGCGDRLEVEPETTVVETVIPAPQPKIIEVSPPTQIQQLRQAFDKYQPQVRILSPQPDEVLQAETVNVRLELRGLPLFQNPQLGLGPHLEFILDNQPAIKLYDLNQPLVLEDLLPGTHTLRVFAVRPWDESYKNQGAYAQTTFHIYTRTEANNPDPGQPLLTYNLPQGDYGAEPIMLDFYLTNAPLHLVAQENPDDNIVDWRIRVTVNGSSFVVDRWEPIYLKGFESGKNWVKLEFLDEQGESVGNVFNNTARSLTYQPRGQDSLSKLIRGELSSAEMRGLLNPNYEIPEETVTPEVEVIPEEIPAEIPEAVTEEPQRDRESADEVPDEAMTEEEIPPVEVMPEETPAEISQPVTSEPISEEESEAAISEAESEEAISEEKIEEAIPEESPAAETVTPEANVEPTVSKESAETEPAISEEAVENNVPEETEPLLPVTTSQPEELQPMAETEQSVETPETVTPAETSESTESEPVNISEAIDRLLDRAVGVVNQVIDFAIDFVKGIHIDIDVKLPWGGGETQSPIPPAAD